MKQVVVLGIAVAVLGCAMLAYAADASKPIAGKEKPVTITGKVEMKDKAPMLSVDQCMCPADKEKPCAGCAAMKGKMLKIGAKAADAEKLAGKDVEVKGMLKGDTIDVTSIAEKKMK